jgi:DNA-binding cell septation regulator SpoVG
MKPVKVYVTRIDKPEKKLRAFANVLFALNDTGDACLSINGFQLFEGKNGLFLSPPSTFSAKDNKWYPTVKFDPEIDESKVSLDTIQTLVIKEYNRDDSKRTGGEKKSSPQKKSSKPTIEDDDLEEWQ